MPGTNWIDLIKKGKVMLDNINKIKGMIGGLNDLNFDSLMAQVGLDDLASQIPALQRLSDSITNGLSMVSNLSSMNVAQIGLLSSISGVPQSVLNTVASGGIPDGFTQSDLNNLVNSLGSTSGIGSTVEYLSGYASQNGQTELSAEMIQQALVENGGSLPGLPTTMGTSLQDAEALLGSIQNIQQTLGGSLNQIGSSISGLFPSDTMSVGNVPSDLFESVGVDSSQLSSDVTNMLTGSQSATSSLDNVSSMLGGLGSGQLMDLTSGIYNIQNIQARIQRMLVWKTHLTTLLSSIGLPISL